MQKSLIIIGAGIAGLAAGCYGQMNGYRTRIFEMHNLPGGVCTAWKRNGYTIDGCIHWLVGSKKGAAFYSMWEELNAVQGREFIDFEEFGHIEDKDGKYFTVFTDVDRLERHMKELAPEDSKVIEEFTGGIRHFTKFSLPWDKAPELYNLIDGLKMGFKMIPHMFAMNKWMGISTADYSKEFKNPFMRKAFYNAFMGDIKDFSIFAMQITLAWMHMKQAGYPLGGSLEFSRAIERRYLDLGGEINYRSRIEKILVENDHAVGIKTADGLEVKGDIIISAADGYSTIFNMLGGKYIDDKTRKYYEEWNVFSPLLYIGLGVARSFAGLPHHFTYMLEEPMQIGGHLQNSIGGVIYNYDPALAPQGKTTIIFMLGANYEYWSRLKAEGGDKYNTEKKRAAEQCITFLDGKFPGLAEHVEIWDVATPLTWERFSGNRHGAYEGWLITTKTFRKMKISKELPGLKNFYMTGQWVEPGGGVPAAAMSARNVMQIMCKRDNKPFQTSRV